MEIRALILSTCSDSDGHIFIFKLAMSFRILGPETFQKNIIARTEQMTQSLIHS